MKKKSGRASNGMGSIRQRPDGRWEARYSLPDGRQKSVYGKTEKEVSQKLRENLHGLDAGTWREPSKTSMSDWLDTWLSDYQAHSTPRTVAKYKCITDKHFRPVLGNVKVVKLLPIHIRRLVTAMQQKGLAATTIQNYLAILGACMESAIEAGLIHENPVTGVKLPRKAPKKFHVIDKSDIPAFIDAANATRYSNELKLMLYTGLRVGEIRGLKWSDVDFTAGTLHVQRQLHPKAHDLDRLTPPKYGETRIIHLAEEALDVLRDQKRKQAEQRLADGTDWTDDDLTRDLVFRQKHGKAHSEASIYRAVRAVGATINIPDLHPHDLRHSYAVAALRSGADVKTVQHNLGHKTSQMTLDVYAAYSEEAGKDSAKKLSSYLKNV